MLPLQYADSQRHEALLPLLNSPMLRAVQVCGVTARTWWPPHGIPPATRKQAQALARAQAAVPQAA